MSHLHRDSPSTDLDSAGQRPDAVDTCRHGLKRVGLTTALSVHGYEILQPLRTSGMGSVFHARSHSDQREVALKFLPLVDERSRVRFEREVTNLFQLKHPHIVRCQAHNSDDTWNFLVMPFLPGSDLDHFILANPRQTLPKILAAAIASGLPPAIATETDPNASEASSSLPRGLDEQVATLLLHQLLDAIGYAHEKGICHRDIKPSNLRITVKHDSLHLTVIDFGVSRREFDAAATLAGHFIGTLMYSAPEQHSQTEADDFRQADIYGIGCVLFECLTGNRPFDDMSDDEMKLRKASGTIPTLSPLSFRPELHEGLDRIVQKATLADRKNRYRSIAEIKADLDRLANDLPIESPLDSTVNGDDHNTQHVNKRAGAFIPKGIERMRPKHFMLTTAAIAGIVLIGSQIVPQPSNSVGGTNPVSHATASQVHLPDGVSTGHRNQKDSLDRKRIDEFAAAMVALNKTPLFFENGSIDHEMVHLRKEMVASLANDLLAFDDNDLCDANRSALANTFQEVASVTLECEQIARTVTLLEKADQQFSIARSHDDGFDPETDDFFKHSRCLAQLSTIYRDLMRLDEALETSNRIVEMAKRADTQLPDSIGNSGIRHRLTRILADGTKQAVMALYEKRSSPDAYLRCKQWLAISQELVEKTGAAEDKIRLASALGFRGKLRHKGLSIDFGRSDVETNLRESLRILGEVDPQETLDAATLKAFHDSHATSCNDLGLRLHAKGYRQIENGQLLCQEAAKQADAGDNTGSSKTLEEAKSNEMEGVLNLIEALGHQESNTRLCRLARLESPFRIDARHRLARALWNLADCHSSLEDFESSIYARLECVAEYKALMDVYGPDSVFHLGYEVNAIRLLESLTMHSERPDKEEVFRVVFQDLMKRSDLPEMAEPRNVRQSLMAASVYAYASLDEEICDPDGDCQRRLRQRCSECLEHAKRAMRGLEYCSSYFEAHPRSRKLIDTVLGNWRT